MTGAEDLTAWRDECTAWLAARRPRRSEVAGEFDVSVFHELDAAAERDLLDRLMAWQQEKFDAGFGAIAWPVAEGGRGLTPAHERAFAEIESEFATPPDHEVLSVTVGLVAPTVRLLGTDGQRDRFVRRFRRAEELCCQLFSEPGAGSDLAGVATGAVRSGDRWTVTGQKVWSSGAQHAAWGELIARTDPDVPKHRGLTAFLVPLDQPGIEVRPIRQMSGGQSFCEVFLDGVSLPDELRLGAVGDGWKVALTTLGFERAHSGAGRVGGTWEDVRELATRLGRLDDPLARQDLARVYSRERIRALLLHRSLVGGAHGPTASGSIGKLLWSEGLREVSDVVGRLLGAGLAADTGAPGTFGWSSHVLGAPGYRIAGGSDEIQRTIIGERVLGLPPEPRADRDVPWRDVPR